MSTSSATDSSRESYSDSPVSQPVFSFPVPQYRRTRRDIPKVDRYYSTPLRADSPDSTPLHLYGLEQREPSIYEKPPPRLLRRFSHALDDIKEDFSLQLDPNNMTNKIRSRRQSMLMFDVTAGPSGAGADAALHHPQRPMTASGPPRSRPLSILSFDNWTPPTRALSRRLSTFRFGSRRKRASPAQLASISQPNLIGSSTDM
ncbi:hypothetical protein CDV55_106655 [Aspergillus turcosus]|uniref:Uncharacterized protein n=1 Tax=Aspergillus turcosus TaxID=1245748 RepID=A0A229XF16_9EURO|nr:hypothetical protein CDV55_106655 [Aspergillus turcosus]RLL97635.1 hypothetical protein CFD26_106788 [Aspergillus turcosus]